MWLMVVMVLMQWLATLMTVRLLHLIECGMASQALICYIVVRACGGMATFEYPSGVNG
jgi:hypothetical protein